MIEVEGFKAFRGTMKIVPKRLGYEPFEVKGDFFYKPEYDCWYDGVSSYHASICEIVEDLTESK